MASLPSESSAAAHPVVASCSLPPADRAQRTADFRALFADAWISRTRTAIGVLWKLRATNATDAESRRLAALEARCCDGIRFDIARRGAEVVWEITGPATSAAILDAFYELPVLVQSDDGARTLWDALDGAACGPATSPPATP